MQVMLKQTVNPVPKATNTVLSVTGLSGGPVEMPLFCDFNLQLPAGLSALLGDEGSGKTA
jgi:ABC-type multidrug transport system ATPase subunit